VKVTKINPVAKYSRNKSGAGYHKSKKDYNRRAMKEDTQERIESFFEDMTDDEHEQVEFLINQQKNTNSASLWWQLEEEINRIFDKAEERQKNG